MKIMKETPKKVTRIARQSYIKTITPSQNFHTYIICLLSSPQYDSGHLYDTMAERTELGKFISNNI